MSWVEQQIASSTDDFLEQNVSVSSHQTQQMSAHQCLHWFSAHGSAAFSEHTHLCLHWCCAYLSAVRNLGTYAVVSVNISHLVCSITWRSDQWSGTDYIFPPCCLSKCHYVKYPGMLALELCTLERWSWPCPVSTQQQLLQRLGIIIVLLDVVYEPKRAHKWAHTSLHSHLAVAVGTSKWAMVEIATGTSFCFLLLPDKLLLLLVSDFCEHHIKLHELANAVSCVKLQLQATFGRLLVASCCPSYCSHIHAVLKLNLTGARKSSKEVYVSTIQSTTHRCTASPAFLGSHDRHCG